MKENEISLIGFIGKDAELHTFDDGNKVVNFTLATNYYYKDKQGEKVEKTVWHNVKTSKENLAQYLLKGTQVRIKGMQMNERKEDKNYSYVKAYSVVLMGKKTDSKTDIEPY